MKITYELEFDAVCPVDATRDRYSMTVTSKRLVPVEDILEAVRVATEEPVYQEAATAAIRAGLSPVESVQTTGVHSGVVTTVTV